jgi:hypothetical protein
MTTSNYHAKLAASDGNGETLRLARALLAPQSIGSADRAAFEGAGAIRKGYNSRRNDYLLRNLPISNSFKLSYLLARRR